MQINNTTNAHNKNLSFGKVSVRSESLAELGSKFARELEAAKPELEKRYGGKKIDVTLQNSCDCRSWATVNKAGLLKRRELTQKPQNFIQKLFNVKPQFQEKIIPEKLASNYNFDLNPEMTKDEIINAVSTAVKEARKDLHAKFNEIYGTVDTRKAKKILDKMN